MSRYILRASLSAVVLSLSSIGTAFAGDSGLALGLRAGYALPMGTAGHAPLANGRSSTKNDLSDNLTGMLPLWVDIGYRVVPSVYVGAFFQYGPAFINSSNNPGCSGDLTCSASDMAFGANLHYHVLPAASFDPWVGLGAGYEILSVSFHGPILGQEQKLSGSLSGFQFLSLQLGGDFKPVPELAVGPFLDLSLGQYNSYSSSATAGNVTREDSGDTVETGVHEWVMFGVRGQFNL